MDSLLVRFRGVEYDGEVVPHIWSQDLKFSFELLGKFYSISIWFEGVFASFSEKVNYGCTFSSHWPLSMLN